MLTTLQIKDYALIEGIEVHFEKGLNIITGETGAGKSIIVDALGLLLGERASTEVVRKGSQKAVVEGIFDVSGNKRIKALLNENEIEESDEFIIRREITLKGSNRCFINDSPVTLNLIKSAGDLLVDLHGQHDHQSLLRNETHIDMLDEFADVEEELSIFRKSRNEIHKLRSELNDLRGRENLFKEKKDIYTYQIKEIDAVSPKEKEDEEIENDLKILENSERLLELTSGVYDQLYDNENSVMDLLGIVRNKLEDLGKIDKIFFEKGSECAAIITSVGELSDFLRAYKNKIDLEPETLEQLRERLGSVNLLKKKYGGSLHAVINHRMRIGSEMDMIENFSDRITEINSKIEELRKEAGITAKQLSIKRKKAAKEIESEVVKVLAELGIPDGRFSAKIINESAEPGDENFIYLDSKRVKHNPSGIDEVEFLISTNTGEDVKPLVKVASGGEISRIMLSLKSVLAKNDRLPLLIFDEIDSGISGRIAQKVGHTLKSLAAFHQIISITHLPQIAGLADNHFTVEKHETDGRVVSSIRKLKEKERVEEVARLMSGEEISESSLKGARELMGLKK
ncbi:MAG: DNA repair protein RecN [bacterium]